MARGRAAVRRLARLGARARADGAAARGPRPRGDGRSCERAVGPVPTRSPATSGDPRGHAGQVSPTADTATESAAVEAWVEEHPDAPAPRCWAARPRRGNRRHARSAVLIGEEAIAGLVEAVRAVPRRRRRDARRGPIAAIASRAELAPRELGAAGVHQLLEAVLGANLSPPLEASRARSARACGFAPAGPRTPGRSSSAPSPFSAQKRRKQFDGWRAPDDIGSRIRLELAAAGYERARAGGVDPRAPCRGARSKGAGSGRRSSSSSSSANGSRSKPSGRGGNNSHRRAGREGPHRHPPLCLAAAYAVTARGCARTTRQPSVIRRRAERNNAQLAVHWTDLVTLGLHARMSARQPSRRRDDRPPGRVAARAAAAATARGARRGEGSRFRPEPRIRATELRPAWPAWRHARWRALHPGSRRARDAVAWAALALAHQHHTPSRGASRSLACALTRSRRTWSATAWDAPSVSRDVRAVRRGLAITASERGEPAAALRSCCAGRSLTGDKDAARAVPSLAERIGVRGPDRASETELLALGGRSGDGDAGAGRRVAVRGADPVNLCLATALGALTLVRGATTIRRGLDRSAREQVRRAPGPPPYQPAALGRTLVTTDFTECRAARHARAARVAAVARADRRAARLAAAAAEPDLQPIAEWVTQRYGLQGPRSRRRLSLRTARRWRLPDPGPCRAGRRLRQTEQVGASRGGWRQASKVAGAPS